MATAHLPGSWQRAGSRRSLSGDSVATTANSVSNPRGRIINAVRSSTSPWHSRCTHDAACCSTDFIATNRMFGCNYLSGELACRPNRPVSINASALIDAFVTRNPLSALNKAFNTSAIAPGGKFDGHADFKVTTASIGGTKTFPNVLGAANVTLWDAPVHTAALRWGGRRWPVPRSDAARHGLPCGTAQTLSPCQLP